jgi:hypothetical protein
VWHASVRVGRKTGEAIRRAHALLEGVGDVRREWLDASGRAFVHLRRALTQGEAEVSGPMRDVRGTPEGAARFEAVRHLMPPGWSEPPA